MTRPASLRALLVVGMLVLGGLGLACAGEGSMNLDNPAHVDSDGLTFDHPEQWKYVKEELKPGWKTHMISADGANAVTLLEVDGLYDAPPQSVLDILERNMIDELEGPGREVTVSERDTISMQLAEATCPGQRFGVTVRDEVRERVSEYEVSSCSIKGSRKLVVVFVMLGMNRAWLHQPGVDLVVGSIRVP